MTTKNLNIIELMIKLRKILDSNIRLIYFVENKSNKKVDDIKITQCEENLLGESDMEDILVFCKLHELSWYVSVDKENKIYVLIYYN